MHTGPWNAASEASGYSWTRTAGLDEMVAVVARGPCSAPYCRCRRRGLASNAKDVASIAGEVYEDRASVFRFAHEPGVVVGQEYVFQKAVGFIDRLDALCTQFLRHMLLHRTEHALRTATCLGRIGMLHPLDISLVRDILF